MITLHRGWFWLDTGRRGKCSGCWIGECRLTCACCDCFCSSRLRCRDLRVRDCIYYWESLCGRPSWRAWRSSRVWVWSCCWCWPVGSWCAKGCPAAWYCSGPRPSAAKGLSPPKHISETSNCLSGTPRSKAGTKTSEAESISLSRPRPNTPKGSVSRSNRSSLYKLEN